MLRALLLPLAGLALGLVASTALAEPRLERERCPFKPPRGDRVECFALIVPENRAQPEGREVRLKVAVLKAKRAAVADPLVYLAGGPGDAPLVPSVQGADALAEGDWWHDTATIRRRRDVIIISQRGGGGSSPNLDCFDPRASEATRTRKRAVAEPQAREVLQRCRLGFERRRIDLSMYATPHLADDVADLAQALSLSRINLYGVSYGTRWGLEVMRRHPELVRSAVFDGLYPPNVNGEQNEPEIVRRAFEQLYSDCAADIACRERHGTLRTSVETLAERAEQRPVSLSLQLDDGPVAVKLDGARVLLVLLHMMRDGEVALVPETVATALQSDYRLLKLFAEDLESGEGGLSDSNALHFDGLFNSIECRETWAAVDQGARRRAIEASGIYGLTARLSKAPALCPVWRIPAAPAAERQPVKSTVPVLLMSGVYDWLTPPAWGREALRHLPNARHAVFRAHGHGVVGQEPCAARQRDEFLADPDPRKVPSCRADQPPNFAAALERARALP
ncbi:MAG: alpha/beta hydrolase [Alphaproteobacteria bacterium]|nr:alpha/beta hydrolase [Alphaproteobacteria bacterium]